MPCLVRIRLTHVSRDPSTASPPTEEPAGRRVVRRFPLPSIRDGGHSLVRLTWEDRALERSIWTAATPRPVGVRCDVLYARCSAAVASRFDHHRARTSNISALRDFGLCRRNVLRNDNMVMSETHSDRVPEEPEHLVPDTAAEAAPRDSEIDFDDET